MIRKNLLNCNLIQVKCSTKSLFDVAMQSFRPELEVCPYCKSKGDCNIHAYYYRYIIDFIDGKPLISRIRIHRVICSCGHTHAVLTDSIIPYDSYSLFFILRVLAEYFLRINTISRICETFCITPAMLYRWKALYEEHIREWQGLLSSIECDLSRSIKRLVSYRPYLNFATEFFQKTGYSFLQSHRNPSLSPRKAFPP